VAFIEGQYIHQSDLLMQIDPRPYQAQLEQAAATKAKDQPNLKKRPSAISPAAGCS